MAQNIIRRAAVAGLRVTGALAFLAPLITRLVIGWSFHQTGHGKLMNFERTVSFFSDLGIPFARANAAFIGSLEFLGGLLLVLGLGTRIFAFLLSCSMVVALATADKDSFIKAFPDSLTDVASFVFLMFLIWLVLYGPGRVSIDYWIQKKFGIGAPEDNR